MAIQEVIRRLTIEAVVKGVTDAAAKLRSLGAAQDGVTASSKKQESASQTMERRLLSIQRQYDGNFRSMEAMRKVTRDLNTAEAQGLVTSARKNELLRLARDRHDDTARAIRSQDSATGGLIRSALRLLGVYLSWRAVVSVFETFLSATAESEEAQTRLETVITSTGGAARLTADELDAMATGFQRVTTFGDEVIKSAQAVLLGYRQIGREVFPDALEATLNMSKAMKIDLTQAAERVGKALDLPSRGMAALAKQGFFFTAQQKEQVKALEASGQIYEAQKIVLKELEFAYGGAARAARGTLGGALKALGEAWGDLFEANGPHAERLRQSVERMISAISDPAFLSAVHNLGSSLLEAFSNALPAITDIINKVSIFFQTMDAEANDPFLSETTSKGSGAKDYLTDQLTRKRYQLGGANTFGDMGEFFKPFQTPAENDNGGGRPPLVDLGPTQEQIDAAERAEAAYAKLTRTTEQRIEASRMEVDVLGMSTEAAARMRYEQELLNQAANDNIKLGPEQRAEIGALASAMAAAEERTRQWTEAYQFGKSTLSSFFADLKSNLMNGTALWDSFGNAAMGALDKVADRALAMASDGLWDLLFGAFKAVLGGAAGGATGGTMGNGLWGSAIFSAKGNVMSGPGISAYSNSIVSRPTVFPFAKGVGLMGEAGEEAIMPLRRNSRGQLGVHVANDNRGGSGGAVQVEVLVSVNDDGKLVAIARQAGRQEAGVVVRTVVPGMIDAQAPAAVAKKNFNRKAA